MGAIIRIFYGQEWTEGYDQGTSEGYNKGLADGRLAGKKQAYDYSFSRGYQRGIEQGHADKGYTSGYNEAIRKTTLYVQSYSNGRQKGLIDFLYIGCLASFVVFLVGLGVWYGRKWLLTDTTTPETVREATTGMKSLQHDWNVVFGNTVKTLEQAEDTVHIQIHDTNGNLQTYSAHKTVLMARCLYLSQYLRVNPQAKEIQLKDEVLMDSVVAKKFSHVLCWIYTDKVALEGMRTKDIVGVLAGARVCKLERLVNICTRKLQDKLDLQNVGEVYLISQKYGLPDLQLECENLLQHQSSENLTQIITSSVKM